MAEPQPTVGWPAFPARPRRLTDAPVTGSATRKLPATPTPHPAASDADMSAEHRRRWAREVDQALAQHSERQITAVRLVYTHELPISEAAAWLGITTAEASGLVADAHQHLAKVLYRPSPHLEPDVPSG